MKPVILESPYAGDTFRNQHYARLCMIDSRERGEAPFVSHLLYTQILDDDDPIQRQMGISAGHSFIPRMDKMVVYTDRGISEGMKAGIAEAERHQIPIEYRTIGECDLLGVDMGIQSEIPVRASPQGPGSFLRCNPILKAFRKPLTWLRKHYPLDGSRLSVQALCGHLLRF